MRLVAFIKGVVLCLLVNGNLILHFCDDSPSAKAVADRCRLIGQETPPTFLDTAEI